MLICESSVIGQEDGVIRLDRFAYAPLGTFGRLSVAGRTVFTVERPWAGNQPYVSCIPEGSYSLRLRQSRVVRATSLGKYREGWEVCDVPGRTYIMIHPGNTMLDVQGCISVGKDLGTLNTGKYHKPLWSVTDSRTAFTEIMEEMKERDEWTLEIKQCNPSLQL